MLLTDAIIKDVQTYYHMSRVVKRYKSQGKSLMPYELEAFLNCKYRLVELYEHTGLNMITACDEDLAKELLNSPTVIAVAYIPGRNICYLAYMAYTVRLFYNADSHGYQACYCYHTLEEAREAFNTWDGNGHPAGNWIKRKGDGHDISNPDYIPTTNYAS